MSWPVLHDWWLNELRTDDSYESVVLPLLDEVLTIERDQLYLDVGAGEGRVGRWLMSRGLRGVGVDINFYLAKRARAVVSELPAIPLRSDSFDVSVMVLVLEHIADVETLLVETARVTKTGGNLAVVLNHPLWTAPGSTPIEDSDGEELWRPGAYFDPGSTDIEVEGGVVTFHHRPLADLLNAAADAGWALEKMIERPHHELEDQSGIPRLLACRWRLLP